MDAASVPMVPQEARMLGRSEAIADAGDDHQALGRKHGGVGERTTHGDHPPHVGEVHSHGGERPAEQHADRLPLEDQVRQAHDRDVGNRERQPVLDAREHGGREASKAQSGDADLLRASLALQPVEQNPEVEDRLRHGLVEP